MVGVAMCGAGLGAAPAGRGGSGDSQAVSQTSRINIAGMTNTHEVISNANPAGAGIPAAVAHIHALAVSIGGEIPANGITVLVGGE